MKRVVIASATIAAGGNVAAAALLGATLAWSASVQAQASGAAAGGQSYPAKPIRVIVPYPAGGTSDILTRMVGAKLNESWGQQVLSDPRPGANGNIGVEMMVRSPADGYTLTLMEVGNLTISPSMYKLSFDIIRDITPITTVTFSPYLLCTHPSVPVKSVSDLIALAKKSPGKLNAPVGLGSNIHLSTLAMQHRVGAKWTYVPTKGGQSSVISVMTGDGDFLLMGVLQTWMHVRSGKLKLIAVSSEQRDPMFPQVPTVAETPGLEGFHAGSWQGIIGPAKLPPEIVTKLYNEVKRIVALPDFSEKLTSQGSRPQAKAPQELAQWMASEKERWAKVVKESGYKID
ncbi:MAG: tripartite tricarboxylate transporter substrate binding protein [Burkholderiales bacterium]|nr:tripartite tricarboxylate transporter substrate binding protein [Burkholderiales bacterium]